MCYTGRKSNECIRSQNRKLSLRAFFAKQSPYRNEEIASSQRTLLAMTQCTEFISAQYIALMRCALRTTHYASRNV